jgi:membrane protein implicated in regulation of membrane protease activity
MILLNVIVAALTATIITVGVANYRSRRLGGATAVGSLAIAATTFACPGCALPVTATVGVAVFGSSLPFLGLEFQVASVAVLLIALGWLSRKMRHEYLSPAMAKPETKLTMPAS